MYPSPNEIRWRSWIQSASCQPGSDCHENLEHLVLRRLHKSEDALLVTKLLSSSASAAERSMLRSMMRQPPETEAKRIVVEKLRKHEYEDDSEDEEGEHTERRARSASYGNVFRNRPMRETPPLRFVREKMGQVAEKTQKEPPMRKLLFDSEFGCYYDPVADKYYTVGNP